MRRFRLSTLMLLVVIAALGVALVMQRRQEANLQARLAQSWPVYLKQQREEALLRRLVAKRSPGGTQQQEREDAELDREIEAMKELAKAIETEARRRPR
jgi:hypothetical protein